MPPDPTRLCEILRIETPLVGFYDAPDPEAFAPLVAPGDGSWVCVFAYYRA